MEKVIFDGEVLNYFDELVFTLFKKEYFSFPENAKKYVDTIVGFVTAEIFTFPPKKSTEKKAPATRREYVSLQKSVLEKMDRHIETNLSENKNYKPATGFTAFCEENAEVLRECMVDLHRQNMTDCEEVQNKIKKTYKNRYFIAINK